MFISGLQYSHFISITRHHSVDYMNFVSAGGICDSQTHNLFPILDRFVPEFTQLTFLHVSI